MLRENATNVCMTTSRENQEEEQLCVNMWVVTFCVWYLHILDLLPRLNKSCGVPNMSGTRHGTVAAAKKG